MVGELPDPCLLRVEEAYAKFNLEDKPLVSTMNMGPGKPMVETAFGLVHVVISAASCEIPLYHTPPQYTTNTPSASAGL